tara:strand:+ start:1368 stop:1703 length:336 start_codon:yes stop_codon:yes gene_type:complete
MYAYGYEYDLGGESIDSMGGEPTDWLGPESLGGYGGPLVHTDWMGPDPVQNLPVKEDKDDYFLWISGGIIVFLNVVGWSYICWRARKQNITISNPVERRNTLWTNCIVNQP